LRPRLAFLADLLKDVTGARRPRERPAPTRQTTSTREEEHSADELKRRLDESRRRLQQEIPPPED
jgi:hypothetical protein